MRTGATPKSWTKMEDEEMITLYPFLGYKGMAEKLSRTEGSIRGRAFNLRLKTDYLWCKNNRYFFLSNPYEQLTEAEKGYIAGIIDGEGSIHIHGKDRFKREKERNYPVYRISVINTNQQMLDWLQEKVFLSKYSGRPITGFSKLPQFVWTLDGYIKVRALLSVLLPYLIIKKTKAEGVCH